MCPQWRREADRLLAVTRLSAADENSSLKTEAKKHKCDSGLRRNDGWGWAGAEPLPEKCRPYTKAPDCTPAGLDLFALTAVDQAHTQSKKTGNSKVNHLDHEVPSDLIRAKSVALRPHGPRARLSEACTGEAFCRARSSPHGDRDVESRGCSRPGKYRCLRVGVDLSFAEEARATFVHTAPTSARRMLMDR